MTTADDVQAYADNLRSHDGDQMAADMLAAAARRIRELERAAGQESRLPQTASSAREAGKSADHVVGTQTEPAPAAPTPLTDALLPKMLSQTSNLDGPSSTATYIAMLVEHARDLERQLAEALVDAERYRWLRTANWIDWDAPPLIIHDGLDLPELLDAAIDAARRKP